MSGPLGFLAEGARTNLALQSQTLDVGATWGATSMGVTANAVAAPDGTTTADALVPAAATTAHYLYQTGRTRTTSAPVTFSAYAKKVGWTFFTIQMDDGVGGNLIQSWNLTTGAVGAVSAGNWTSVSASIQALPSGWYRCIVTATGPAGTNLNIALSTGDTAATLNETGDASKKTYVWGVQAEDNVAFASSHIPTTTVAVARNADVLTYPTAGNIANTAGTAYVEFLPNTQFQANDWNDTALLIDTSGNGNTVVMWGRGTGASAVVTTRDSAGNTQAAAATWGATPTVPVKVATSWGADTKIGGALGGTAYTPSAAYNGTVLAGGGTFQVGGQFQPGATQGYTGTIRNVRIWNYALSASALQSLTS